MWERRIEEESLSRDRTAELPRARRPLSVPILRAEPHDRCIAFGDELGPPKIIQACEPSLGLRVVLAAILAREDAFLGRHRMNTAFARRSKASTRAFLRAPLRTPALRILDGRDGYLFETGVGAVSLPPDNLATCYDKTAGIRTLPLGPHNRRCCLEALRGRRIARLESTFTQARQAQSPARRVGKSPQTPLVGLQKFPSNDWN